MRAVHIRASSRPALFGARPSARSWRRGMAPGSRSPSREGSSIIGDDTTRCATLPSISIAGDAGTNAAQRCPLALITRDLPMGQQPPDQPEREWKRLVGRYRSSPARRLRDQINSRGGIDVRGTAYCARDRNVTRPNPLICQRYNASRM